MRQKRISTLLVLILIFALTLPAAAAAKTPTVYLEAPASVKAGEQFEVRVRIADNPGLCAVQFTVQYDGKAVECESCVAGAVLEDTLHMSNAKGEDGAILAAATVTPVTADGTLGVCTFKALKDGTPKFGLGDMVFSGSNAEGITVTVGATDLKLPSKDQTGKNDDLHFSDTDGSFAKDAIDEAAELGLILGYNGKYRPNDAMTRGECVTILYRAMGSPKVASPATFTDLTHEYYRDAIAWAEQNGVVKGVGGGRFNPGGQVTRAQLATILFRLSGSESGMEAMLTGLYDQTFTDSASIPAYAKTAVYWAVYKNIWCGTDSLDAGTKLAPNDPATRAQIAVMITRYLDKYPAE